MGISKSNHSLFDWEYNLSILYNLTYFELTLSSNKIGYIIWADYNPKHQALNHIDVQIQATTLFRPQLSAMPQNVKGFIHKYSIPEQTCKFHNSSDLHISIHMLYSGFDLGNYVSSESTISMSTGPPFAAVLEPPTRR